MVHNLRKVKRHYVNKPPVNEQLWQSTRNCCYSTHFHITHQTVYETNSTHSYLCKMTFRGCDDRLPSHITLLQIQPLYAYAYRSQMTHIVEHPVRSGYKIHNTHLLQNLI